MAQPTSPQLDAGVLPAGVPATVGALAAAHRLRQQILAGRALSAVRRFWSLIDPRHAQASWDAQAGPAFTQFMTAVQAEAARGAQDYVEAAVERWGVTPDPAGQVNPAAFAGVAADGRALDSLLSYPAFEVEAFVDQGMDSGAAMAVGQRHLERIVATETADAARTATGVAQVNDREVHGWVRMVKLPACSRCLILAGKWYAVNRGFKRHPQCDCIHMPAVEVIHPQSPRAMFDAMSPGELRKAGWSDADVRAIQDGADLYQVTNAHRDLRTLTVAGRPVKVTLHGGTRRGLAGKRLGAAKRAYAMRLTPEQIYLEAERLGWSRDEIIRQLKRFAYIL